MGILSQQIEPSTADRRVLVTGPSGAGRTTAIRALEDLGYEAIDNLPLSFVPRLLEGDRARDRRLADAALARDQQQLRVPAVAPAAQQHPTWSSGERSIPTRRCQAWNSS